MADKGKPADTTTVEPKGTQSEGVQKPEGVASQTRPIRESVDRPADAAKTDRGAAAGETSSPSFERDESTAPSRASFMSGPIDIRSIALAGILLLAAIYTLYVARSILIPLVLAILLSLMLRPPVRFLSKYCVPDAVGAGLVMAVISIVLVMGFSWLSAPAETWMNEIPRSLRKIEQKLRTLEGPFLKVKEVSEAVEDVASVGDDNPQEVRVKEEGLLVYLLGRTQDVLLMLFLTAAFMFFLLASGDLFFRKLVRVVPRLQNKKQAVDIVHQIQHDVTRYVFSITIINMGLGIAIATAMYCFGMPNPALWGVMAFFLNYIPYLGAVAGVVVVGVVGFVQGDSIAYPLAVMAAYGALTSFEGTLLTPMILGERLRLNPFIVFLALIVWGWLWGIPGALLAVPILATFKILCDRLEPLNAIGEFIGR